MKVTAAHAVEAAVLAAAEQARWPDGSRILDVSDQVLVDVVAPAVARSLAMADLTADLTAAS